MPPRWKGYFLLCKHLDLIPYHIYASAVKPDQLADSVHVPVKLFSKYCVKDTFKPLFRKAPGSYLSSDAFSSSTASL